MFTGLIQSTGKITGFIRKGAEARLSIRPAQLSADFVKGESIAVNGACLTVETFDAAAFTAYASAETLSCTNLGFLRQGDTVNLERALHLGDSLGGHLVSGHIDALAEITNINATGSSLVFRLSFPPELSRQIIAKGSVALDGVSLTVNACTEDYFEVNIIPSTQNATTVATWKKGQKINLETDLIGKYVERQLLNTGDLRGPRQNERESHTSALDSLTLRHRSRYQSAVGK
ncbi:MAG: riboflavin synthase [Deltaproteobacteria bacterium]|jgi:riboflavin synthase|nr:riboflavin synthase [Deltaproteobacteria bacterium]